VAGQGNLRRPFFGLQVSAGATLREFSRNRQSFETAAFRSILFVNRQSSINRQSPISNPQSKSSILNRQCSRQSAIVDSNRQSAVVDSNRQSAIVDSNRQSAIVDSNRQSAVVSRQSVPALTLNPMLYMTNA
jgi:hypothetical protein